MDGISIALLVVLAVGLTAWITSRLANRPPRTPEPLVKTDQSAAPDTPNDEDPPLEKSLAGLTTDWDASLHPSDLLDSPHFERVVVALNEDHDTLEGLLDYLSSAHPMWVSVALEALTRRDVGTVPMSRLLRALNYGSPWVSYFALRAIARHAAPDAQIIGAVLARSPEMWMSPAQTFVENFMRARIAAGERPSFEPFRETLDPMQLHTMYKLLSQLEEGLAGSLRDEVLAALGQSEGRPPGSGQDGHGQQSARAAQDPVGQRWSVIPSSRADAIVEHAALLEIVERIEAALGQNAPPSFVLVGEDGTGKTTVMRLLGRRLRQKDWTIVEAQHTDLIAGQVYIGQFEERFQELIKRLEKTPRALLYAPNIHELLWTGQHSQSRVGALDLLLPHLESRRVVVIGETDPEGYERILRSRPRYRTALQVERISPLSPEATLDLVQRWAHGPGEDRTAEVIVPEVLSEATQLAEQFLAERAAPGNVLDLLKTTRQRLARTSGQGTPPIGRDDLMATLSQMTGLPPVVLDDRQQLDLGGLRAQFESRVMGQPEAINCLVDRVAMLKAGLTDPTRPLGVFLFAGPTGTGKTEIAKVLAEFLFGRQDRMIRIDMSELQTPDSLSRLLGSGTTMQPESSLVDRIREQPFAVVLLDEFEKAPAQVWHMFLQVFDDGRLTDNRGMTVSLRHAIIIMTSNLGPAMPSSAPLGFTRGDEAFRPEAVERVIASTFSREFLNRIDQVIVFRPLSRETMRAILRKELRSISQLRGLRWRDWAIEWDEEAFEFLLEQGFTPDLGARPLRRAIERHLLTPLATVIAKRQAPAGDQFLFVHAAGGRLQVDFVDPDEPDHATLAMPAATGQAGAGAMERLRPLTAIVLDPHGTAAEAETLRTHYDQLREQVEAESWRTAKRCALERTSERDFWNAPDRFEVLGAAEYQDRIERVLQSAGSLLTRLVSSHTGPRERLPRRLIGEVAQKLYLLDVACSDVREGRPRSAFLGLECVACAANAPGDGRQPSWGQTLGAMYRAWAEKRGMSCTVLEETDNQRGNSYRLLLAVSGFGAHTLLAGETGLHVAEYPRRPSQGPERQRVHVAVVPQPVEPPGGITRGARARALCEQARAALAALDAANPRIVRSYRMGPAPLVRDAAHGWRTGRLDQVLGGDFDLMLSVSEPVEPQKA